MELERLREVSNVVDIEAVLALVPAAMRRYRAMVADLGNAPIDMGRAREMLREALGTIPVRPGRDGVPIALLAL